MSDAVNQISGSVSGSSVQARQIGAVHFNLGGWQPPRPAQLPQAPRHFTDRDDQLIEVDQLTRPGTAGTPVLIVLTGLGGVGKTAFGLHWLHQIRRHYPDGQLYIDLRGAPLLEPVSSPLALERFLRALGVDAAHIPDDVEERASLFRTLTTDRRLIIMLDNAASDDQIQPLLPGHGPSVTLVTTRRRLPGLATLGAYFRELPPLDTGSAIELLARIIGHERIAAEPQAAQSLARQCGQLPLTLAVSGAQVNTPILFSCGTGSEDGTRSTGRSSGSSTRLITRSFRYGRGP